MANAKNNYITECQLEIMKRHALGETEQSIAIDLKISINTVKYHKKLLFRKLDVKSTPEAISMLKNKGIL